MFTRIRNLLAKFDLGDFDEAGLIERLAELEDRSPYVRKFRAHTMAGMPAASEAP
jgi:hypothetical protein